ncbi:acylphosphatase-2-like [Asbolus verrucosus]|uniref:acylphosphatase n=1 Tax=Asbolus verrucosus TaxID=1661398 RepID=A0A482VGT6_ASBVE|nr:acylphosphatase-2-like [Asbolus verrucosus]
MNSVDPLVSVEFEVYGRVQGVYFTKYCKEMCEELGIGGWVKNTKKGTIQGKLQGLRGNVDQVVDWLSNTGSPGSQIDHCDLNNWQSLATPDFRDFTIRF